MMDYIRAMAERVLQHEARETEKRDAEKKVHDDALAAAADYMRDIDVCWVAGVPPVRDLPPDMLTAKGREWAKADASRGSGETV